MTIYVDDMQRPARVGRIRGVWSHLLSDLAGDEGQTELVAFARRLGLNPAWIQNAGRPTEHFDVTEPKRQQALRLGAVPITYGREGANLTLAKARGQRFNLDGLRSGTWTLAPEPALPEPGQRT